MKNRRIKAWQQHTLVHYIFTAIIYIIKELFFSIFWFILGFTGVYIFQTKISPFDKIIGLPLAFIGFGFVINSVFSSALSILSSRYNKAVCYWCSNKYKE